MTFGIRTAVALLGLTLVVGGSGWGCARGEQSTTADVPMDPNGPPVVRTGNEVDGGDDSHPDAAVEADARAPSNAAPLPVASTVTPARVEVGSPAPTVTVTGKSFVSRSVIQVDGKALTTTFVSATELKATLPQSATTVVGALRVGVETSAPGGGRSATLPFEVVNPAPRLSSLTPVSAPMGSPATTLTLVGEGFTPGAEALFAGTPLATTFADPTRLTAILPSDRLGTAGSFDVAVRTPAPGGGTSSVVAFIVENPLDVAITSLTPATADVASPGFTLTVRGSGFVGASTVSFNGVALVTTFVGSGELTAPVPPSLLANVGDFPVVVSHPQPGGGTTVSSATTFRVVNPAPVLTACTPTTAALGAPPLEVILTGSGFMPSSQVTVDGVASATTFVGSTQLRFTLSAAQLASPGARSLRVVTAAPGGGTSAAVTFSVDNPFPQTTGVSPAAVTVGAADTVVTLTGSGFVPGSVVRGGGVDLATQLVSATQIKATLPAARLAAASTLPLVVWTPGPGGGTSSAVTFTIENVVPQVSSLAPSSVVAGASGVSLTVTGLGFVPASVIRAAQAPLTTTYVSATQLTTNLPSSLLANAGVLDITVWSPAPGGGSSPFMAFTISNPSVNISAVSPSSLTVGASQVSLTVSGSGFVGASTVLFNGADLATTFVSASQLQAVVPGPVSAAGDYPVTVRTPPPGGGVSAPVTVQVRNPVPVLTSASPSATVVGAAATSVTLTGSGFLPNVTVARLGTTTLPTTVLASTQLTTVLPASALTAPASLSLTVENPAPGGGVSSAQTFNVSASCDTTGVDHVLTSLTTTTTISPLTWTGTAAPRFTSGVCTRPASPSWLSSGTAPVLTYVVQNNTPGAAVLSTWAQCASTGDAFLAVYKRGPSAPTSRPTTDAERMACTGWVSEGSSGATGPGAAPLTSPEAGGSSWCPGLTKANGAGLTLAPCERAVVQVQPYSTTSTIYTPPTVLKVRLEAP